MQFSTASCILTLVLIGFFHQAAADSFMETWLASQQAKLAQMGSSDSFDQNDWLARQHQQGQQTGDTTASKDSVQQDFAQIDIREKQISSGAAGVDGAHGQGDWAPAAPWEQRVEDLEKSLLSDIEKASGKERRHYMEGRIATLEESMKPMFQAMPKNEFEKLGHSSVRYMLHRFFVDQHGWSIDGLFTEGAALNTSSPAHALKGRVPMFVEGIFEKRLGGQGMDVHEMAVLVAVVEDSIHQEAQGQLQKTYKALGLELTMPFDEQQLQLFVEVYMSGFVMSTNMSEAKAEGLYRQHANMVLYYPTWPAAQDYFGQVLKNHAYGGMKKKFLLADVSAIVKDLVDTFGTFHGKQCQGLKSTLKGVEGKTASGCISLPDFYKKGLKADSNWLFIESPDYLRNLGVLDETDPKNPRLLAANYINSPSNCLQPTGYYMVCCHNECDDILGKLERQLGQPTATPAEITEALIASSSSLRAGTRKLAPTVTGDRMLRHRLQEVANHHEGRVPIHGRLFAQWLHHVFPHECAYPHVAGSKHPQWVLDFEEETHKSSQLSDAQMESFLLSSANASAQGVKLNKSTIADAGSCAPWQDQEELFAPLPHALAMGALEDDAHPRQVARGMFFVLAITAFLVSIRRTCKSLRKVTYQSKMLQI